MLGPGIGHSVELTFFTVDMVGNFPSEHNAVSRWEGIVDCGHYVIAHTLLAVELPCIPAPLATRRGRRCLPWAELRLATSSLIGLSIRCYCRMLSMTYRLRSPAQQGKERIVESVFSIQ